MDGLAEPLNLLLKQRSFVYALFVIAGVFIGWLIGRMNSVRRIATLEAMLQYEVQTAEEKVSAMRSSFAELSSQALQSNNQQFLNLAEQTLGRINQESDSKLKDREQSIEQLVKPLQESLKKSEHQLSEFDRGRRDAHARLTTQIELMSKQHVELDQETRRLVQALRRPEIRGQWGEISLRRLVELAGMTAHCDFSEQVRSNQGRDRPDMVIYLPGNRHVVVDVKTPMDAYLSAYASDEEESRQRYLKAHGLQVKKRIDELSAKTYWAHFEHSPEFVILFIPGDQFLGAAIEYQPNLIDHALSGKIILATPTSLVALLRTVSHGWTQEKLNEHALEIRQSAEEYHQRLAIFSEHLESLGQSINRVVETYNTSVGSYQRKLLPIARQFSALGLRKNKEAVDPDQITAQTIKPR